VFQIDVKSRKPIYAQVVDNFKRLIFCGVLAPDDKVPSVRDLAQVLTINPNTVQKAYRVLEAQGYFYTVLGQGNFISVPDASNEVGQLFAHLREVVQELIYRGVTKETIIENMGGNDDKN
jgi:GntR family transcriptional regulator